MNIDLLKVDFSNYESPIQKIVADMQTKMIEQENIQLMMEVKQAVGFAVSKEELLKALQYDRDQFAKGYKAGLNADRWISVKDQLPEEGEYDGDAAKYYLVQNEYGDMMVARYTHSGYWEQIYQLKPIADEIVAWQPLPEPAKVGDEE